MWLRIGSFLAVAVAMGLPSSAPGAVSGPEALRDLSSREVLILGRGADPRVLRRQTNGGNPLPIPTADALRSRAEARGVFLGAIRPLSPQVSGSGAFPGGAWVASLRDDGNPAAAMARLREDPDIRYVGPNHVFGVVRSLADVVPGSGIENSFTKAAADSVNDPLFPDQNALQTSRVPEAWARSRGAGILIAIIDTGIELDHPDLATKIAVNVAERDGSAGVDDDGNGYVDDVTGYDFTDAPGFPGQGDFLGRDTDPSDDLGHGTQVAGVAAAAADNDEGIAGVAPDATILAVRAGFRTTLPFFSGLLQEDDIAAAVLYAVDRGAHILNLSFGDAVDAPVIGEAIRYARDHGVLVVAAAGNTPGDQAHFPSTYPGVFSAGALDAQEGRAPFSTFGQDLDLLAPGTQVLTTNFGGGYGSVNGTSFSAPMTAGVAALVWSLHPEWTADQIAWKLRLTARRNRSGWAPADGWGLLDAAAAVAETSPPPSVQLDVVENREGNLTFNGSVADPSLLRWSFSVLPESEATSSTAVTTAIRLATDATRQAVSDSLAVWIPPADAAGVWVARLTADVPGLPLLEERTRFLVPGEAVSFSEATIEAQVGEKGWDIVGSWFSEELQQGALRFIAPGGSVRTVGERTLASNHGVRMNGPLPPGNGTLEVLGRTGSDGIYRLLNTATFTVPHADIAFDVVPEPDLPPGTPMEKAMDWDGDLNPEVLVETPFQNGLYGEIVHYEFQPSGSVIEVGGSAGNYRGIPIDAADADQDGLVELITFRLDSWVAREPRFPGEFPLVQIYSESPDVSVPVGFLDLGGETVLLSVAGNTLRVYRPDPSLGYRLDQQVSSEGLRLQPRSATGDIDHDGRMESVFTDEQGNLVVFEWNQGEASFLRIIVPPFPVIPELMTVPVTGGHDLLTVEIDPPTPEVPGDFDRASARVRRWDGGGASLAPVSELAFGGIRNPANVQLFGSGDTVVLRLDRILHAVQVNNGGVGWGGVLAVSQLGDVDGGVLAMIPGESGPRLWLGSTSRDTDRSQHLLLNPLGDLKEGVPIRVVNASAYLGGVLVTLGLEPDACASGSLTRSGDIRGSYSIPLGAASTGQDTVAVGERVTYTRQTTGCLSRETKVLGRAPQEIDPLWEGDGRLAVEFDTPLDVAMDPNGVGAQTIRLHRPGGSVVAPEAVVWDRSGMRWLISVGDQPPDSLEVIGAWDVNGMPLGGAEQITVPVPPFPAPANPPVLARVRYRGAGPELEVDLAGGTLDPGCGTPFVLEPLGWELDAIPDGENPLLVSLPEPLSPGSYVLRFRSECVPASPDALGSARQFRVGTAIYPNPAGPGQELTLENLQPGFRVEVFDVKGNERLAWDVLSPLERRPLTSLSPGLYFLRILDAKGGLIEIEKLMIAR